MSLMTPRDTIPPGLVDRIVEQLADDLLRPAVLRAVQASTLSSAPPPQRSVAPPGSESSATVGFGDIPWKKIGVRTSVSYVWPKKGTPGGNPESYGEFELFEGQAAGTTYRIGVGKVPHGYVTFVVGPSGAILRPITVFFQTQDYPQTHELVGLVRGRDGTRAGWRRDEAAPTEYDTARLEVMGDRIPGKRQRLALVVSDDDEGTRQMLDHCAAQLRMRGLV